MGATAGRAGLRLTIVVALLLGALAVPVLPLSTPAAAQTGPAGGFALAWNAPQKRPTGAIAWGDLNADGRLDLLVGNQGVASQVFLGDGAGGFALDAASVEIGLFPGGDYANVRSLAPGDYDGDGDLDLALASDAGVLLYRNCTRAQTPACPDASRFVPDASWQPGALQDSRALAWGDADSDGHLDLAVSGYGAPTRIFFNDGAGALAENPAVPAVGAVPGGYAQTIALAWGDIDGDGDLDLALGNENSPSLIYRNDGSGRLAEDAGSQPIGGSFLVALAWGDLDNDGDLDLVLANSGAAAQLYRNDGAGGLALDAANPAVGATGGGEYATVRSLALADVDVDGDLDISLSTQGLGAFVYRNDGRDEDDGGVSVERFPAGSRLVVGATVDSLGLAWGDADGDGDLDLALGNYDAPSQLYRNPGAALLRRELPEGSRSYAVALADVDGDADLDVLLGNQQGPSQLFRNDGAGGMTLDEGNPGLGQLSGGGYATVTSAAWGDVEADGDLDLLLGVANGPSLLYRNNGDGALTLDAANPKLGELSENVYANILAVAWGDVDGDGALDLAMAGSGASILYRNSGGVLTPSTGWAPEPAGGTALAWGDVDGDTDLDLLLGSQVRASRLFRNCAYPDRGIVCPDGALLALDPAWTPTAADTVSAAWGDVDGDGALDLALGNSGNPSQLFRNQGGRLVLDTSWIPEPALTTGVAWVDIDLDGDLDLSMANNGQASRVYLNDGAGRLSLWPLGSGLGFFDDAYIGAQGLAWGDLSGDGRPDLALASRVAFNPDLLYLSGDGRAVAPNNAPPSITVGQPDTPAGDLLASARVVATSPVSFTLRLRDREGDPVGQLGVEFSLDGGGTWSPALPAAGSRTHNLATLPEQAAAPIGAPLAIPDGGTLPSALMIAPPASGAAGTIQDVDLYVNIDHPAPATLSLLLRGPGGVAVPLLAEPAGATGQRVRLIFDDEAATPVTAAGANLQERYRPGGGLLAALDGTSPVGTWTLELRDGAAGGAGQLLSWGLRMRHSGVAHTFAWDSFGSRFFGRSDSVLLRLTAFAAPLAETPAEPQSYRRQTGGPVGQTFARAATQRFRGQGIQIQVTGEDGPVAGALVYHRPAGAAQARLLAGADGGPLVTNSQGYLAGRSSPAAGDGASLGRLEAGDGLAALLPLGTGVFSDTVERYYTSEIALDSGAPADQIQIAPGLGVQEIEVSAARPLLLFNLRVGVEWDASSDPRYREELAFDLRRASELLYDWTDGQAALGTIRVGYGRESLERADIRVYATNRLRPNATQGGVVTDIVSETLTVGGQERTTTYNPGAVNMGAVWTRFGGGTSFGEDWARALAHELGHYLLYLDDNYLGRDAETNALIGIPQTPDGRPCRGAMSDPYRDDFSELQPPGDEWDTDCARTLAALEVGRADWETVKRWYDLPAGAAAPFVLSQPGSFGARPGPAAQILDLTTVALPAPGDDPPLVAPIYSLVRLDGAVESRYFYRPGSRVRAFRFSADGQQIIDLGRPTLDQIDARGARAGDTLCVYDLGAGLSGCRLLDAETSQLTLYPQSWLPDIEVRPLPDSRLQLTVWADGLAGPGPAPQLQATLFPGTSPITVPVELALQGDGELYQGVFALPFPLSEGYLRLRVADDGAAEGRREIVSEFVINGAPVAEGPSLQGCVLRFISGQWLNVCNDDAPVTRSADGQMLVYADPPEEGEYYSLQTATSLPRPPAWAVAVGQPYRLVTNLDATDLADRGAYLNAAYLESELPAGSEGGLALYYYRAEQGVWQRLTSSRFDPGRNELAAQAVGDGLYALMTRVEARPGWNLVSYPWPERLAVLSATAQLNIAPRVNFVTIHAHEPADLADPWKLYDVDAPYWINDLDHLEYGRGYWFIVPPDGGTPAPYAKAETAAVGAPTPPAIIYGVLRPGGLPAPAEGLLVEAYSGDTLCARGITFAVPLVEGDVGGPEQIVFRLSISLAGQGAPPGCGIPGQPLSVRIAGVPIGFTRWDNTSPISFSATYLPLVAR